MHQGRSNTFLFRLKLLTMKENNFLHTWYRFKKIFIAILNCNIIYQIDKFFLNE